MTFKHFDREFRTQHKVFLLSLVNRGQSIKVLERNRVADFQVTFALGAGIWLCEILKETVTYGGKQVFFRKFRGSSYVLLVRIKCNKWERFLAVTRLQNGVSRNVIIPEGSDVTLVENKGDEGSSSFQQGQGGIQENKYWRLAVVIYRDNLEIKWEAINFSLSRKLRSGVKNIIGPMSSLLAAIDGSESKASLLTGGTETCKSGDFEMAFYQQQYNYQGVLACCRLGIFPVEDTSGESILAGPATTKEDVTTSIREEACKRSTEWRRDDDVADRMLSTSDAF
ncbi:hypothetical protein TorRG33x02_264330 [Trema orientale]|uniref:Uncharacterized protein n=1 Tax=Trema orientale TaxID=63057 RepID=A0A2P5D2J1_TREOI|nr:hypothetical protein TorRG33x02_264330 [Trema orientale]